MPTTPTCQPGEDTTSERRSPSSLLADGLVGDARLQLLLSALPVELLGESAASARSSEEQKAHARPTRRQRPAAFSRGPSLNPTSLQVTSPAICATDLSARTPAGRRAPARAPEWTRTRLGPVSGTTSAMLPSATRIELLAQVRLRPPANHPASRSRLRSASRRWNATRPPPAHAGKRAAWLVRVEDGHRAGRLRSLRGGVVVDHDHVDAELRAASISPRR